MARNQMKITVQCMKPRFNKNLPYPQKPIPVLCSSKKV